MAFHMTGTTRAAMVTRAVVRHTSRDESWRTDTFGSIEISSRVARFPNLISCLASIEKFVHPQMSYS